MPLGRLPHRLTRLVLFSGVARPFGLRFTVFPVRCGEDSKMYYTVTVQETMYINRDGEVDAEIDYAQREKEDWTNVIIVLTASARVSGPRTCRWYP